MDIIKNIYNFYQKEFPQLQQQEQYLLTVWCNYIHNGHWEDVDDEMSQWVHEQTIWNFDKLKNEPINWQIIEKYVKKQQFFNQDAISNAHKKLQQDIRQKINYYLHLIIQIHEYLWT